MRDPCSSSRRWQPHPVGTQESTMQAIYITRPGGHMGFVGVNYDVKIPQPKRSAEPTHSQQAKPMKIRMIVEGARVTATLDDNAISRDFASLLPLTLPLDDRGAQEGEKKCRNAR